MASKKKRMAENPLDEIIPETTNKMTPKRNKKKSPNRTKKQTSKDDTKEKDKKTKQTYSDIEKKSTSAKNKAPKGDKKGEIKRPRATKKQGVKTEEIPKSSWPKVGFRFRPDLMEVLNWAVYCTGKNKQEILNEALESHLNSLDLPKMPKIERK